MFIEKETLEQVFSCKLCEIFKNTFLTEHLGTVFCPFWAELEKVKWTVESCCLANYPIQQSIIEYFKQTSVSLSQLFGYHSNSLLNLLISKRKH